MRHPSGFRQRFFQLYALALFCVIGPLPIVSAVPALLPDELPAGLSSSEWAGIQAQIKSYRYHARPFENGAYRAVNPAQGWLIDYRSDGYTRLSSSDSDIQNYHISFRLESIGYGDSLRSMPVKPQQLQAQANTLDYHWNDRLTERWVNSEAKLEQWFLLSKRLPGTGDDQPLRLQLTLDSNLTVNSVGNALHFSHSSGIRIHYDRLKVWDADGKIQTAWLQLDGQTLSLLIDEQQARYPLTIDPSLQQQAYLKASNSEADDEFGKSVAISGDTVVVGARWEDSDSSEINQGQGNNAAADAGAAYVFTRSDDLWTQQAYLKASNAETNDQFGVSVAISGNTVVVGAHLEDSSADGVNGDQADNLAGDSGAVYVFNRSGGVWTQQAYLKASNPEQGDQFGISVAISGDTLVVGAHNEDSNADGVDGSQRDNSAVQSGAAYVFTRTRGAWSQQAYLKASNSDEDDQFGYSVAISDDTIVAGAWAEASAATGVNGDQSSNARFEAGAAYVFTRTNGIWSQQAYLKASNTGLEDQFGYSVAISGNTAIVGAPFERSNATGVNGDQTDNSRFNAGAAYVFSRSGITWSQQAYMKASNSWTGFLFGNSVTISGDTAVVGAPGEPFSDDSGLLNALFSGAAYVFTRSDKLWSQQAYLKASNIEADDFFGWSVAYDNNTMIIGAFNEDSNASSVNDDQTDNSADAAGAAYIIKRTFIVSGLLSGLNAGATLVLQNNGMDLLTLKNDGLFIFATSLDDGSTYNVTVQTHPTGQICTVSDGSGSIDGADIANVTVNCITVADFIFTDQFE